MTDLDNLRDEARALRQRGKLDDAARVWQEILRQQPDHAEASHHLGVIARRAGMLELSVQLIGKAVALDPANPDAHRDLGHALRGLGRHPEALASYDHALALRPGEAETHFDRGNLLSDLRRHDAAIASYDRAIALAPAAAAHFNRGNALLALARHAEAIASYHLAIGLEPDFADAHCNLGNALRAAGRFEDAIACYDRAIALNPDLVEAHYNRGNALQVLRRHEDAQASYEAAIALRPDFVGAWLNRGNALSARSRHAEAIECYDRVIASQPAHAAAHNNRGLALARLARHGDAVAAFRRAIAARPDFAEAHANFGASLGELGRYDEAIAACEQAIALRPDLAAAHAALGHVLRTIGRIDDARRCFERASELEPRHPGHLLAYTRTTKVRPDSPRLRAMLTLADDIGSLDDNDKIDLHFALGKALGDFGDHERAFGHQVAGNALRRRAVAYDEAGTLARLDRIRTVFSAEFIRSRQAGANMSETPVFIVGMPRSGSTLVEQILASHPRVFGAGEVDALSDAATEPGMITPERPFPDSVSEWTDARMSELAENYLGRTRALAEREPERRIDRITDKMLFNFRYAGLISMILPNARIVHMRRDPVDTCLSCFSVRFKTLDFGYDLGELGRLHRACSNLMAHWRSVLPPGIMLDVDYEALVENFAGEARRVVAHCGLEWDDACLRFHETARPVHTASAAQVRQPIYRDLIRRWRPDDATLRPLLEALGL